MKIPKKYVITTLVLVGALFIAFIANQIINAQPNQIYARAKKMCPTEIWLVEQDAVWTDIRGPIAKPYPNNVTDVTDERVIDFGCSQKTADQKK